MNPALNSTGNDSWGTPDWFLDLVRKIAPIDLDPCGSRDRSIGAGVTLYEGDALCGLKTNWGSYATHRGVTFVNPPYSRLRYEWGEKIVREMLLPKTMLVLIPARTDTKFFQQVARASDCILLLRGRIKFLQDGKESASAPFPSAVLLSTRNEIHERRFVRAFAGKGLFVDGRFTC